MANLDEKILFGTITHLEDIKMREVPAEGLYENGEFCVPFWSIHSDPDRRNYGIDRKK